MYGFIYITTNKINGKKYLGMSKHGKSCHKTYLGSGKQLKQAIAKYGRENFSREIIAEYATKEELSDADILREDLLVRSILMNEIIISLNSLKVGNVLSMLVKPFQKLAMVFLGMSYTVKKKPTVNVVTSLCGRKIIARLLKQSQLME